MRAWGGTGGLGPLIVGSPTTVADSLQKWVAETDVDGFNLAYAVTPETFEDIVDLLVSELQATRRLSHRLRSRHAARDAVRWRRDPAGRPSRRALPTATGGRQAATAPADIVAAT